MTRADKVVVTGSGAVCAAGMSPDAILDSVRAGRSAIAPIRQWDTTGWPCRIAAEIPDFNPRALVEDRKLHKLIRRTDLLGLYAAGRAIDRAGIVAHRDALDGEAAAIYSDRTGVYVGSGGGNYENQYEYFPLLTAAKDELPAFGRELSDNVNPMWLLRTLPNNVLGHIGIRHRLKGANACITNHSVGGTLAVIEALEALRTGEADRAVAVGHETPIEPQMVLYYQRMGLLASGTLYPFDERHDGSLFGEGAAALVLETEASAKARNASVQGEVLGGGYACEALGLAAIRDDGDGLARAIRQALDDAGIAAAGVGMIVAHANGTPQSDRSEAAAIRTRFRDRDSTGDRFQVGDRPHDRGGRDHRSGAGARGAREERSAGHRQLREDRSGVRGAARVGVRAKADERCRARPLPRICGDRRRARRPRALARPALPNPMADAPAPPGRCGIDSVEIARIERLLAETPAADLDKLFSKDELADSGTGPGRAASLAARFAAKEACVKLFPREAASGEIVAADFAVATDNYGAPRVVCGPRAARRPRPPPDRVDRIVADPRPRQRIGRRARAAHADRGAALRPAAVSPSAFSTRNHSCELETRLRRYAARGRHRCAGAGALRASLAAGR